VTRWRTAGRTNFELVREFVQELPNVPAMEAWKRAYLLARESPLDPAHEPRLSAGGPLATEAWSGEMPTANHPFFWAGYLLVDTSPRPKDEGAPKEPAPRIREPTKADNVPPLPVPSPPAPAPASTPKQTKD
jgi:hypothetical protein